MSEIAQGVMEYRMYEVLASLLLIGGAAVIYLFYQLITGFLRKRKLRDERRKR